ncbi:MAG: hypothetical protein DSM106950_26775 [Stigonema ocellatum SAG 48.90 = DSM 106950]|nr:hypothetical protein [Stigonema ocellatum SAG 48.90 = DSM 106950]
MEYIAYASMVIANEGENIESHLPQLELNWKKNFKSARLNFATIAALVMILVQAEVASAAYYVNTNGSCLNVRTGPSFGNPVVTCISNGALLKPVVRYRNGFAELSSGNWVSAQWISTTPGSGYSPGLGVGGQYPEYFNTDTYHHHRHRFRQAHYHRDDDRHVYTYSDPGYGGNTYNDLGYGSNTYNYPPYTGNTYNDPGYGSNTYNYPPYTGNTYNDSGYGSNTYNYPPYTDNTYNYRGYGDSPQYR